MNISTMKINIAFIAVLALLQIMSGCSNNSKVTAIENGAVIKHKKLIISIQFYDNRIVRISKTLKNNNKIHPSLMVISNELPKLEISKAQTGRKIFLSTNEIAVVFDHHTGHIEFFDKNGLSWLLEENSILQAEKFEDDEGFSVKQNFLLTADEGIYGLGQHQYGYMNYRNKEVVLLQSNCDAVNPFLISTRNYGVLWDNYSKTVFTDSLNNASIWSEMGNGIDYYFIGGQSMDEVIAGYRKLTGHAPMYGKWAYGYWQSKEHYDTQHEIDSVATRYRELKMPIDNMIQDWDYWNGPQNWSGMFFDKELFPEPEKLISRLHSMNYKMMISIWPALGPNTPIYKDMLDKGYLFDPVGWAGFKYYDAFNPEANNLYWKYLKEGLYDKGIDAWWIDSTEPDIINALTKESHEYEMKKVGKNYLGSWARYINAFSLSMTDALYKNMRADSDKKRVYILTRSTFGGQQRNAATTWSGDIGASWSIYKNQIAAGLNHSMSGIPYWTFDIGAFVLGSYGGVFTEKKKTPAYDELYARMFQFGAFCPIFRSHGSDVPREIFSMENHRDVLLKYTNLRYRLLPYIYSLAWQVTNEHYTIMRGLAMDFNHDKKTYSIDDQYLFGPSIMVCPVTDYFYHEPPQASVPVPSDCFSTADGQTGLNARYFMDKDFSNLSRETIDQQIDLYWYTGRPKYATDSMYSVVWSGKLTPIQTGKHQFHVKTFDQYKVIVDGQELVTVFSGSEKYLEAIVLEAGKAYDFEVRLSNKQTGAARMLLFWKTPDMFAVEGRPVLREKSRKVYLPEGTDWYDFWTGNSYSGGQTITAAAPIDIMPLYVPAGSIVPMGPFLQYATEKETDPMEIRIYQGKDGSLSLYEDENDNYNYEKGRYSTILFHWKDSAKQLFIEKRKGEYPGILKNRTFHIILVKQDKGTGLGVCGRADQIVNYCGEELTIQL